MNLKFPKVVYVILLTIKNNFYVSKFIFLYEPYKHVLQNFTRETLHIFKRIFMLCAKRLPLAHSRGWVCVELMQNVVDQYRRMNTVF